VTQDTFDADSAVGEAMRSWMAEATKASQDLEKEAKNEESDLGEAVPKGEEEKKLRKIADLIDEVDPKNASEIADLAAALAQDRTWQRKLRTRGEGEAEVDPSQEGEAKKDEERRAGDALKSWMADADRATGDIDREIDEAISELAEEVPKSDEERDLERVQRLIDATDPENASDVADLAASLARSGSFTRRIGKFAAPSDPAWTQKDAKKFWSWLKNAEEESSSLDQDLDASRQELAEYLRGMTGQQERAVHRELRVLEEIWAKYGLENESATAEDVMEKLDAEAPTAT